MARSAQDVINDSLRDNESWEWLVYAMAILLAIGGTIAIGFGIITDDLRLTAIGSAGVAGMFGLAMRTAIRIRRENIRVRLTEIPLAMAKTSKEAAGLLRDLFNGTDKHRAEN